MQNAGWAALLIPPLSGYYTHSCCKISPTSSPTALRNFTSHQTQRTSSFDLLMSLSCCSRASGTVTMPTLGSIVQKGKFAAAALPFSTMALNRVDCVQESSVQCYMQCWQVQQ